LYDYTATALRRLLEAGDIDSVELTRALLQRIAEREPTLGAWIFLDPDLALAQAAKNRESTGLLAGIPIGVKDLMDTRDMPTAYGSKAYAAHQPEKDAACVRSMREAGAVVMGKTVTTEFAAVFEPGKTVNPYDRTRSPGGSSSGSAAAVADRMVPLAIGTQTAGSVIRPAAYCGVFGFKPTFGAIPFTGVKPVSTSLDTIGIFARSTEDLLLGARVLACAPATASFPTELDDIPPPRVLYLRSGHRERASPAVVKALDDTAQLLRSHGATVDDCSGIPGFDALVEASDIVLKFEAARALRHEYQTFKPLLAQSLLTLIETGSRIEPQRYEQALATASAVRRTLASIFHRFDVVLTPATVDEAPPLETTGDPLFCRAWTLLGNPATTVPGLRGPNGLPIGIQLAGAHRHDARLLQFTRWVAALMPKLPAPTAGRRPALIGA
jgi:Asp-tRNA(Asn)/Glu-tRNA(Gln) amidotransferase A subunit family amidase